MGSDRETSSDFQLIAGTHRDLRVDVAQGRFREDLYARINLWSYDLPGLAQRPEDIEPNVDHLLMLSAEETGAVVRFNAEARTRYLKFAKSSEAKWIGNFRDLSASITRLATLADGGRIPLELVEAEIQRLNWLWQRGAPATATRRAWTRCCRATRPTAWTCSIVCSSKPSSACAGNQTRCPRRGASCTTALARNAPWSTTLTVYANIC
jgi:sigma54-dependent transcription regulator